ncbi:MAG: hypothetical protein ACJ74Q_15355 [Pyrinomonadaceae bacterium]
MAECLGQRFPEYTFAPEEIRTQVPALRRFNDCCSWTALGRSKVTPSVTMSVCSWSTMAEVLFNGRFEVVDETTMEIA